MSVVFFFAPPVDTSWHFYADGLWWQKKTQGLGEPVVLLIAIFFFQMLLCVEEKGS